MTGVFQLEGLLSGAVTGSLIKVINQHGEEEILLRVVLVHLSLRSIYVTITDYQF